MKALLHILLCLPLLLSLTGCELDGESLREELDAALTPTPDPQPAGPTQPTTEPDNQNGVNVFLWKPNSESDGNLVILLPNAFRGRVQTCSITGGFGTEEGNFTTDSHNGNRPHYRFSRPGAAYGNDINVQIVYDGNEIKSWRVPNGASRYEQSYSD